MSFKDHFSTTSAAYAQYRPLYPAPLVSYLTNLAKAHDAVWDCGCGNGQLSVPLADTFKRVYATDASAEQIECAAPHPRIVYTAARAENSGLADRSVDMVTTAQAAHWFDLPGFYKEVRRVARPGSPVALISYSNAQLEVDLNEMFQAFYAETLGPYWPPERRHIEAGYRDLAFPFREAASPGFTFEADWPFAQFRGYLDTWSAIRALEKAGNRAIADDFFAQLEKAWGNTERARKVRWPLTVRAGYID